MSPNDIALPCWEHFDHQADIGVRGLGHNINEAFEQAALSLMAVITDPDLIQTDITVNIDCHAEDDELLLVDWLNALVFEMATRHVLFGDFSVQIKNHHLLATVRGTKIDMKTHQPVVEIKGATFTSLYVGQSADGTWVAQTVVDV